MDLPHFPELAGLRFFFRISFPVGADSHSKVQDDLGKVYYDLSRKKMRYDPSIAEKLEEFNSTGLFLTKWWMQFGKAGGSADGVLFSPLLNLDNNLSVRLEELSWFYARYGKEGFSRVQVFWEMPGSDQPDSLEETAITNRLACESARLSMPAAKIQQLSSVETYEMRASLVSSEWLSKLTNKLVGLGIKASDEEIRSGLEPLLGKDRIDGLLKAYSKYQPFAPSAENRDIESSGLADFILTTIQCSSYMNYRGVYNPEAMALAAFKQGAVLTAVRNGLDQSALETMFGSIDAAIQVPLEAQIKYAELEQQEAAARRLAAQVNFQERSKGGRVKPVAAAITLDDTRLDRADLFYVTLVMPFDTALDAKNGYATLAALLDDEGEEWKVSDEAPVSIQRWKLNPPTDKLEQVLERNPKLTLTSPLLQDQAGLQYLHHFFSELEQNKFLGQCIWRLHFGMESAYAEPKFAQKQAYATVDKLRDNVALVHTCIINPGHMELGETFSNNVLLPSTLHESTRSNVVRKARTREGEIRNIYRTHGFANANFNHPLIFIGFPEVRSEQGNFTAEDATRAIWKFMVYGREMMTNKQGGWKRYKEMDGIISDPANFQAAITRVEPLRIVSGQDPLPVPTTLDVNEKEQLLP